MSSTGNDQPWVVLKFGGSSVATLESWLIIRDLLNARQKEGLRPVVVHSAIYGVSSALDELLACAANGDEGDCLTDIIRRHEMLAGDFGLDASAVLGNYFVELEQLIAGVRLVREVSDRVQAKVMAMGELMSTALSSAWLNEQGFNVHWHDARDTLCSDDLSGASDRASFLSANCAFDSDKALQDEFSGIDGIILTQGFIARNSRNETVLLGRGGSDTSASYFAARLDAQRLEIWTDVPGMFSADPHQVTGSRLLKHLRYQEAQEIASTGGSILHPRCIAPVRTHGIPLWVRSTSHPVESGTEISAESSDDAPRVKAISRRHGITLVSMETLGMWQEVGFLADAFKCFSDLGLSIDLVSTSESNVTVTLDPSANSMDVSMLKKLEHNLERLCRVEVMTDMAVVSLVGQKIRAMLHEIGPALEVFQENPIHLLSQAASDLNLSFVVNEEQAHRLVQRLHSTLIESDGSDAIFGQTWEAFQSPQDQTFKRALPWWQVRRDELIDVLKTRNAAYVYDRDSIVAAVNRLKRLDSVDQVFYAIKANSNAEVLKVIYEGGLNFEVVSPGEIDLILSLFPDISRERILFTPNFAGRDEYAFALDNNIRLTLDNLHPLKAWGDLFKGKEVFVRLDPGQGRGHHEHVKTAGVHAKFGIPLFEIQETKDLLNQCDAIAVGLHAHTGSGILDADNWEKVATDLTAAAEYFPDVRVLDLGGGLGIPEKPGQSPLDMKALDLSLKSLSQQLAHVEIWLEPGRYVVAEAGVLLAKVNQ
ncbi:MAG: bifunctional aspartate kinase/diaminopimelate decarboxylase, partial [Pseudomonadota bacterium]|nr:bifunctional aspartate kinase/diaminopimelate decarboxylase [Pseudomonadota bacterium]